MTDTDERKLILEMVASGKITAVEGIQLLKALQSEDGEDDEDLEEVPYLENALDVETEPGEIAGQHPYLNLETGQGQLSAQGFVNTYSVDTLQPNPDDLITGEVVPETVWQPEPSRTDEGVSSGSGEAAEEVFRKTHPSPGVVKWDRWWWIPLWAGVGITIAGSLLMFWAWQSTALSFWFACSSIPFLVGVTLLAFAWGGHRMRWLHVRIQQAPGERPQKIAISLPLPLGITAWGLRTFGHLIPGLEAAGLKGVLDALSYISPEEPFYVEVDEGENGERVEVFIG